MGNVEWYKRYVRVLVSFDPEGRVVPVEIIWDENRRFRIDEVLDVQPRPALKVGGQGDCYTIRIAEGDRYQTRQLFFERSAALAGNSLGRWFVEARKRD